jgi:hypothetical protein
MCLDARTTPAKKEENPLTLEVPDSLILTDGSSARVVRIIANVIDAKLVDVVYTVEKDSGAWSDVSRDEVRNEDSLRKVP